MIDQYPPSNGVLTSLIWRKTASGGETSLSGYDDASQALSYTPGQEQVYLNGILLVRGSDYTATTGTSITGLSALAASDYVQINCYNNFSVASVPTTSLTGTVTNAQLTNSAVTVGTTSISLGSSATTVAGLTLTSPTISTISNTGILTLPTSTDTLVGRATTDTLTNKTLTSPVISTISNTGTLTLPTSTDTLVGRATTDTLTNKTISTSSNTLTGVINNTLTTTTGDIIYASSANTPARLGIGSSGQVLTVSGGIPAWAAAAAGGKVLQVVSATSTGGVDSYTSTYVDSNLSASITPSSTSSKILILGQQNFWCVNTSNQLGAQARIMRGSTAVMQKDNFFWSSAGLNGNGKIEFTFTWGIVYLDSPATTSATTYKTQFNAGQATSGGWSTSVNPFGQTGQIILLEIGA